MKCILCHKDISEFYLSGHVFYSGVVQEIIPNYGSCHDLRKIKIGICDNCISESEKNRTIEILNEEVNPYELLR